MTDTWAMTLRRLGETADGKRDEHLKLVVDLKSGTMRDLDIVTKTDFDIDQSQTTPRYAEVKDLPKRPPVVRFVHFERIAFIGKKADGTEYEIACVAAPGDALFWTDSSMEKFLYPYYEQLRIFPESDLTQLKQDIRDPQKRPLIVAVRHDSPSNPKIIQRGMGPCSNTFGPGASGIFYLVPKFAEFADDNVWFTPEAFRKLFEERFRTSNRPEGGGP